LETIEKLAPLLSNVWRFHFSGSALGSGFQALPPAGVHRKNYYALFLKDKISKVIFVIFVHTYFIPIG
jgi:hypothetical protein